MIVFLVITLVFFIYLIALAWIDLRRGILPDLLTLSLLWLGLLSNAALHWVSLLDAVWGAVLGYLILWLVYWAFRWARHKEGLGFGDLKFLAALGAWFGWQALPGLLCVASVTTLLVLLGLKIFKKYPSHPRIPFGPGLAFAGGCFFVAQALTFI
jgi:prepilin signal peptidase PulO-like enzyme (type II secretory pathway)